MKYKVEWIEVLPPTQTGKVRANVFFEGGVKATIWQDFPNFATIASGSELEGDLVPSKDGKYAPTLYPPKVSPVGTFGPNRGGMAKVMETKQANIRESMEVKYDAIKMAGAIRDAVLITVAKMGQAGPSWADESIQTELKKWQKYVYDLHNQPFV